MAQHPAFNIARAIERIDQLPLAVFGDGIDGEVAPLQVLLQRHRRIGIDHKAAITAPGLAFGARQRVFFVGLRVQEHREIAAYRAKTLRQRSEEHTSELQSLMRNSYAVFCLKKKKQT